MTFWRVLIICIILFSKPSKTKTGHMQRANVLLLTSKKEAACKFKWQMARSGGVKYNNRIISENMPKQKVEKTVENFNEDNSKSLSLHTNPHQ